MKEKLLRIGAFLVASWLCFIVFAGIYRITTKAAIPEWWGWIIIIPIMIGIAFFFLAIIGLFFYYAMRKQNCPCPCGSGKKKKKCCGWQ